MGNWLADHPAATVLLIIALWLLGGTLAGEQAVHDNNPIDTTQTLK